MTKKEQLAKDIKETRKKLEEIIKLKELENNKKVNSDSIMKKN